MLEANSFDLWQKDAFFSAADEVQQSADIMESMYRMWVREMEDHQLRRDLQVSLATAKWQLDQFDKAVRFTNTSAASARARHTQFVDIIHKQISFVQNQLRDSLAQDNQTLSWVHLDEEEEDTDSLQAFLSGSATNTSSSSFDSSTSNTYNQFLTINSDTKYVVQLQPKQDQIKMWTAPNFGSWKIVIADEDKQNNTFSSNQQTRARVSNFLHLDRYTKLLSKRFSSVQTPPSFLLLLVILLLTLTIFFTAKLFNIV